MAKNKQITELNRVGQSIWYDNLSRDVLNSGELAKLIDAGVSGLTSNPTIFKAAIADTNNYDQDMSRLSKAGNSTEDICEELMVGDVGRAADLLKPSFQTASAHDGHASIEVSPTLARNAKATVSAANRLWEKLRRPNIMIKIPATLEGIPAIQATLEAGINVNITLIFSVQIYEQVVNAYLTALENRLARGEGISQISSVASFFVSRVDAICEKKFDELVKAGKAKEDSRKDFFGKVGIANSKLAYEKFEELFGSARFKKLEAAGAAVQRPLWASTGTKNPTLSPVLYVEELAGKHTVNTVPPATLKALMSQAVIEPRLHSGLDDAKRTLARVNELGLPFDNLLLELQEAGVVSFAKSYEELLASIEQKRKKL
jgi:transaldolase